jgi:hypothetical protein
MTARDYIEAVARELSQLRGRGLVLSPSDAQLALGWHAAGVPLAEVVRVIRTGRRLLPKSGPRARRGSADPQLSLRALAPSLEARQGAQKAQAAREVSGRDTLTDELLRAAAFPGLPARAAWERLAHDSEPLLARSSEAYWSAAIGALLASLRELPRPRRLATGAALRERMRPRPQAVSRQRFRRSLQLQLLRSASELHQIPPAAFLL